MVESGVKQDLGQKPRRVYDNRRRAEQARATRRRVLAAAHDLLLAEGYAGTTMAGIARAANVSVESVYKGFGSKAALVKELYDVTLAGDDEPIPIAQRPEFKALAAEPDPRRKLAHYAALAHVLVGRVGPLLAVLLAGARGGDPELREFAATVNRERLLGATGVVRHVADVGALRPGLDVDRARDIVWTLISPEVHDLLVVARGWSLDDYETWLAQALADALLPSTSARPAPRTIVGRSGP